MTHLSIKNTSYGQKKGQKSKCQFDFHPLQVMNCLEIHVCKWCATYSWKSFDEGYKFASNFTSIKVVHNSWPSKVLRLLILGILILNLGVLGQNDIWMQPPWIIPNNTIRGKVATSPKFRSWWVSWVRVCLWFICAPKVFQPHTKQLIIWFVHVSVNN
jgi:hypothetical protein